MSSTDPRRHSPAADRNKQAILQVLRSWLPAEGLALEIAAGTGQHACHFAAGLPGWQWVPTDADPGALASITAWRAEAGADNLQTPAMLDVGTAPWPRQLPWLARQAPDLVFNANMVHISPWARCSALMRGAAGCLAAGGRLVLYGPFLRGDGSDAAGNLAFDADLRSRNPEWGVRTLQAVQAEAAAAGLRLAGQAAMPANNLMLRFERREGE